MSYLEVFGPTQQKRVYLTKGSTLREEVFAQQTREVSTLHKCPPKRCVNLREVHESA